MGEWRNLKLSEAVWINPPVSLNRGANYPFVEMAALNPGEKYVEKSEIRLFSGVGTRFEGGDTLMARITPCLENGKLAMYRTDDFCPQAHGSTEFIVFRNRPGVTHRNFVHYLVTSPAVREYAISQMTGTSGRQRVPTSAFDNFEVWIPSLNYQEAIADLLGALDDKIELNRRMNETLETMARAIFKDWFVDFGPTRAKAEGRPPYLVPDLWALFPDALDDDDKPVGWEFKPVGQVVEFNPSESLSKGSETLYLDMAALPTQGSWPEPPIQRPFASGSKFRDGDTLLARITPCLENGKTAFLQCLGEGVVGWGSTEFIVLRPKEPFPVEYGYLLARDEGFRDRAIQSMTGTSGRQRVQTDSLAGYEVILPGEPVLHAFGNLVHPWFEMIRANAEQSQTLAGLRDLLLPKLMSGEIRLRDAEKAAGGAS